MIVGDRLSPCPRIDLLDRDVRLDYSPVEFGVDLGRNARFALFILYKFPCVQGVDDTLSIEGGLYG